MLFLIECHALRDASESEDIAVFISMKRKSAIPTASGFKFTNTVVRNKAFKKKKKPSFWVSCLRRKSKLYIQHQAHVSYCL